jgi:hypothetical protein
MTTPNGDVKLRRQYKQLHAISEAADPVFFRAA